MPVPNRPASQNKYPEQYMGNTSFDEDFGVNTTEGLTYNPLGDSGEGSLERITVVGQGNAVYVLGYSGSNLTSITKTVGGIDYQKTFSYTGENLTGISAWSEV